VWHRYESSSYFSIDRESTSPSIIAAVLLSFGVLTIVPTIITASAPESDLLTANNINNLANNPSIGKQIIGSQDECKNNYNDNKKDHDTTCSSQGSYDPTTIPMPIPNNNEKIKTNPDVSSHDDKNILDKNNNNDNKDSKGKDTTTTTLRFPFP
jgi:hypothetical protein